MTTTSHTTQNTGTGGERDLRTLLPLWRIRGLIRLQTPLSIGSGYDEAISIQEMDGAWHDRHVISVTRDDSGRPFIPGSSVKGALNALADDTNISLQSRSSLFGTVQGNKTLPGGVEFCNLTVTGSQPTDSQLPNWINQTANLPHVARNRDYGTAEDKLLFLEQVVAPDTIFTFECSVRGLDKNTISDLLGLLVLAGDANSPLRLGSGKSADNGRISWTLTEVRLLDNPAALWQMLNSQAKHEQIDIWSDPFSRAENLAVAKLILKTEHWLALPELALHFHTPFLVYHSSAADTEQSSTEARQAVPRTNHTGRPILPTDSLHGALRSQAERILRTIGIAVDRGYELPAVPDVKAAVTFDLASILFGAPGWRSVLRFSDFVVQGETKTLTHEMLAIDRLTGGGKNSAKFNIEALDCPQLHGCLAIDLRRLSLLDAKSPGIAAKALGLLAHVLRDLDEGDVPLGYGAAKGYGRSRSNIGVKLAQALCKVKIVGADSLSSVLQAFAALSTNNHAFAAPQVNAADKLQVAVPSKTAGDFHNPYMFIPLGKAKPADQRLPWVAHSDIQQQNNHHSHALYANKAFHGRLVCRLKTVTPIFIGAGDVAGTVDPKLKQNFRLNGEIALPATSLRGMLSSLHEAITGSALRVMDDQHYSVRAATNQALQNKGTIIKGDHKLGDGSTVRVWKVLDTESKKEYLITPAAQVRLQMLCDERTEQAEKRGELSPELKPAKIARNNDVSKFGKKIRFVEGQTVFFDHDGDKTVTELAYSQIWRKIVAVDSKTPWLTTNGLTDPIFSPLTAKRDHISPTESLFGYVEVNPKDAKSKDNTKTIARAFATKVHIGFGRALTAVKPLPETVLKILASPKPPSPAMYFQQKHGPQAYVSKEDLAKSPEKYTLKGRKVYLHSFRRDNVVQALDERGNAAGQRMPWQTAYPEDRDTMQQKVRITPIDKNNDFIFEVDFTNLSQAELESLCACLAPDASFEHKLGMGKPIGLGSVKIDFAGLYLVDRSARYRQMDFTSQPRYASVWKDASFMQQPDMAFPGYLEKEFSAATTVNAASPYLLAQQQIRVLQQQERPVFNAILLAGDPNAVHKPVHYPQLAGMDIEQETFKWFVDNDGRGKKNYSGEPKYLASIDEKSNSLPVLSKTPRKNTQNNTR